MRKVLLFLSFIAASFCVDAQITVTGSTGADGNYTSFTLGGGVFSAINATAQTGNNIVVTVIADVPGETGATSLNAGTWTTLKIMAGGGASRIISGTPAAGTPLINLNGADNVTIDGLNTGSNALTIANFSTGSTAGTSTIRFIADATNNTVTNCTILGSSTSALATVAGTILFSTGTGVGNDGNTISNCNIGPAGTTPSKAIMSSGTATTLATGNSGILIDNNNIYDFFLAAGSLSGINIVSGNDNWTISNNRLYQTATRTFTGTALRYAGITLNQSAPLGSFTITGNAIGFAASNGTGTTTITGSTNEFRGIDAVSVSTTVATSIQGNTISGISQTTARNSTTSTASCFVGIMLGSTGGSFNCGNTTGNTIGSLDGSSSIVINQTSTTASTAAVTGIYDFSINANNISNNAIGTITINNGGSGTTVGFKGIYINTTTGITTTLNNNTIGGTAAGSITDNLVGSYTMYGIQVVSSNVSATGNIIRNMSGNSTGASLVVSAGIVAGSSTGINTIAQNTVHSLSNASGTVTNSIYGFSLSLPSTANIIERNFIHSLNITSTLATCQIWGISTGAAGTATYRNNMVRLGIKADGTAITSGFSIIGFRDAAGATNNFYHNSVYIGGTGVIASSNSYCFFSDVVTVTRNFQNNIFWNARGNATAGGAAPIAIRVGGSTPNPAGLTSNFNDLYVTGTDGAIGVFNAVVVPTIAAWRTATGQDANSFSGNPQFIEPVGTASTVDLHISPTNPTQIESGGVLVASVTNDYDGQTRSGLSPVDMGADAGNFTVLDLVGPSISYTALTNTNALTNRSTSSFATITDINNVDVTAGTKPRLYYKKSADANDLTGWKFVEASNGATPFDFTIDYALLNAGSVTAGDVIQYFVVAQDLAGTPNVSINAGSFAAAPTSVALTSAAFPIGGSPSSYTILAAPLAGPYTVGVSQAYATITAAITDLNVRGVSAAVTFSLTDAIYAGSETYPLTINAVTGASASNTITIKPTLANTTITGSATSAIFVLNGADYVTIDGSISATANTVCPVVAASRDLTITNSNTGTNSAVIWLQTAAGDGATNNTIKNCNIVGNSNITTLFAVGSGSSTIAITSLGTGNSNNAYINNNISKTQYGIYSQGASAANKNTGTVINQNLINTASPDNVQIGGVFVGFESNITVSGNNIANMSTSSVSPAFGISMGLRPSNTFTAFTGNEVTGAAVTKNTINSIVRTGDGSSCGITLSAVTSVGAAANTISNNMVAGVRTTGATPQDFPVGILIGGGAQGSTSVYHNSVYLTGVGSSSAPGYAIAVGGSNPVVDLRNNIFINKMTSTSGKMYAIGFTYSTFTNLTSNNNNFYASPSPLAETGALGGSGVDQSTLLALQTITGKDAASKNVDVTFASATNLHIDNTVASNVANLNNTAATGTGITDDIDCDARGSLPDIGADQFGAPGFWTGATSTVWNTTTNWDDAVVPTSGSNITVPAGASNMPALDMARTVGNLSLGTSTTLNLNGQALTINGAVSGAGTLTGSSTSSLIVGGVAGTLNFTSGARSLKDLTLGTSATANLGTALDIANAGTVNIGASAILTTGDNLTLKSDGSGTAIITPVGAAGGITGNVTIERYIPAGKRGFRLLSPGVTTTNFIKANWQEGATTSTANPTPNYGTHITGATVDQTNGFDGTVTGNASLFQLNNATQLWGNVANTNATNLVAGNAYRILIRGNRAVDLTAAAAPNTATTLRATGTVTTGTVTMGDGASTPAGMPTLASGVGLYSFVGNPYASPIDWNAVGKTELTGYYWIWDPTLATSGAYVSCFIDGTKSNGSSAVTTAIQPGQAFFVVNSSNVAARSLVITEANKTTGNTNVFRTTTGTSTMGIQLFLAGNAAAGTSQDGANVLFNSSFSNAVNDDDAGKFTNIDENIAVQRGSKLMSIERRNVPANPNDTVFLKTWQFTQNSYTLRVASNNFDASMNAYLQDSYLNSETQLNLSGTTDVTFSTTAVAASTAANRFKIVFRSNGALPVSITGLKAFQQNAGVQVEWNTVNETNMAVYEVEKSIDGTTFSKAGTVIATGASSYNWLDASPVNGNNYYRIKLVDRNGTFKYTQVVNVKIGGIRNTFTVVGNPVKNKTVTLQMGNVEKGSYTVNVFNNLGQQVASKTINHAGGSATETIALSNVPTGTYQLSIVGNNVKETRTIIVE